jgi:hypothetical protein
MAFRTLSLAELKRRVTFLYNKDALSDDEYRILNAMENEIDRRGYVLVEQVIIRSNARGRRKKVRRVPR